MGISWAILNNPIVRWLLIVASVLIGVKIYGEKRERDGRIQRDVYWERRQAEERARMTQTATRIEQEHRTNADRAIEAGRTARPLTSDSMSDTEFASAFGFPRNNRKLDSAGQG